MQEIAQPLKALVNSAAWNEMKTYVDWRRERLFRSLLQVKETEEIHHVRGQIEELERLLRLRDEVNHAEKEILSKGR